MASNMTAGLQSMLLIERWYPGKYSVPCTLRPLPAMVARGTMLHHLAGTIGDGCQVSLPPPRRDNPTVWDSHCKQRCVVSPFAEPWRAGVPVCGPPIQQLPAPAHRQSTQIRDPVARDEHLRPLGLRHVGGPPEQLYPFVAMCSRPHTEIVEVDLIRHSQPDVAVLVQEIR